MRFFVTLTERECKDAQEKAAMLRHRLKSIEYQEGHLKTGLLRYAFRSNDGLKALLMFAPKTLAEMDKVIKRDPGWAYSHAFVIPVVTTQDLVRETQEFLGETILTNHEVEELDIPVQSVDPKAKYWLAWKEVKPFSPLLSDDEQNDVYRRTLLAQKSHGDPVEFSDENPVGMSVGILVAKGNISSVKSHVETCDVFPDTVVEYTEIVPLALAWKATREELIRLRRTCEAVSPFQEGGDI